MNKKIALVSLLALVLPVAALAQVINVQPSGIPPVSSLPEIVNSLEMAAATVFGLIAVICFIIAGILFMTAGGNPEKVQAARSAFIWGIAGVVVGILAYSIIAIVGSVI